MMPQGMKKALQSMRYLQTTKHKTQGKYQSAGAHTFCSINQGHALPKNPFIFQMLWMPDSKQWACFFLFSAMQLLMHHEFSATAEKV